jgi:hypothetical protein
VREKTGCVIATTKTEGQAAGERQHGDETHDKRLNNRTVDTDLRQRSLKTKDNNDPPRKCTEAFSVVKLRTGN